MRARVSILSLVAAFTLVACRREPPAPPVDAAAAPISSLPPAASPLPAPGNADAGAAAGPDPGALPQTHDKPEGSGVAFDARMKTLWDAIVSNNPDQALPAFFPVTAYEQVKAIPSPSSDWRRRLVAAFKRDIHALHKRLGDQATSATLVTFEVPNERARWVEPNEESNKLGYYRVYGTKIVYANDGKSRSFEVSSLISWRGEWYVVHLTGFK